MWKSVNGYEGYYEVNEFGVVRSLDRYIERSDGTVQLRKAREMTQWENRDGYLTVKLSRDGVSQRIPVHRLVGMAFVDV